MSGATAIAVAAALLLSISGRTGRVYPDIHEFLANRVVPAMNAISSSIAEQPADMAPP